MTTVWLREVDAGTDNACWVVCAKGDPGAVEFSSTPKTEYVYVTSEPYDWRKDPMKNGGNGY